MNAKLSEALEKLMVSLMIYLLMSKAIFSEPYNRTVSSWSSEEFWSVESNLYTPLSSSTLWTE